MNESTQKTANGQAMRNEPDANDNEKTLEKHTELIADDEIDTPSRG